LEVTHLATQVSQFKYKLPYSNYCGGVVMFTESQFQRIGGYPNDFWGWGGEDDAFLLGIKNAGLKLERRGGKFQSLAHEKAERAADRRKWKEGRKSKDGYDYTWFKPVRIESRDGYILKKVVL
jgi:predicted glycosyltransferase involved in capsule biosynthesis